LVVVVVVVVALVMAPALLAADRRQQVELRDPHRLALGRVGGRNGVPGLPVLRVVTVAGAGAALLRVGGRNGVPGLPVAGAGAACVTPRSSTIVIFSTGAENVACAMLPVRVEVVGCGAPHPTPIETHAVTTTQRRRWRMGTPLKLAPAYHHPRRRGRISRFRR